MKGRILVISALLLMTKIISAQSVVLSPKDYEQKLVTTKDKQIVDVRTMEEYVSGHIKGAMLIDFYKSDFKSQLSKLDKSKPIFVYCAGGGRSGKSANILKQLGFKQIFDLDGGLNNWIDESKPVVKGKQP